MSADPETALAFKDIKDRVERNARALRRILIICGAFLLAAIVGFVLYAEALAGH